MGPEHPSFATSFNNLAAVLHEEGDLKQAKEHLERTLDIMLQKLGAQHPSVPTSYYNLSLAAVLHDQGDLRKANEYLERALDIKL